MDFKLFSEEDLPVHQMSDGVLQRMGHPGSRGQPHAG